MELIFYKVALILIFSSCKKMYLSPPILRISWWKFYHDWKKYEGRMIWWWRVRSINFTSRYDIRTLTKLTTVANSKSNSVTELDHFLFLSDWIVMDRRMIPHLIIEPLCIFPVPDQHLNRIYFSRIISILLHDLHRTISNFNDRVKIIGRTNYLEWTFSKNKTQRMLDLESLDIYVQEYRPR